MRLYNGLELTHEKNFETIKARFTKTYKNSSPLEDYKYTATPKLTQRFTTKVQTRSKKPIEKNVNENQEQLSQNKLNAISKDSGVDVHPAYEDEDEGDVTSDVKSDVLYKHITEWERISKKYDEKREKTFSRIKLAQKIYAGKSPLTLSGIKFLDEYSQALKYNPNSVFALLRDQISDEKFRIDDDVLDAMLENILLPPCNVDLAGLDLNEIGDISIQPRIRYLPNIDLDYLSDYYHEIKNKVMNTINAKRNPQSYISLNSITPLNVLKFVEKNELDLETAGIFKKLSGLLKMAISLSYQLRFGTYQTILFALLSVEQSVDESTYFQNIPEKYLSRIAFCKKGIDLVGMQVIRKIFTKYDILPFRFIKRRLVIQKGQHMSSQLPLLLLSLFQLCSLEFMGAMNSEDALVAAKYLCWCASESLNGKNLETKNGSRDWLVAFFDKITIAASLTYNESGIPVNISYHNYMGEMKLSDSESFSFNRVNTMTNDNPIKNWAEGQVQKNIKFGGEFLGVEVDHLTDSQKTAIRGYSEWLRYIYIVTYTLSNTGVYNMTSLLLEYHKSLGIQMGIALKQPEVLQSWEVHGGKFNHLYDWYSVNQPFGWIHNFIINEYGDLLRKLSINKDFEETFVLALTNKSGGPKVDISDKEVKKLLGDVSNTRFISYALEAEKYDNFCTFVQLLQKENKCTIRYQIDRRARIITIVSNAIQASEIVLLFAFNQLKTRIPEIAVGKQSGNMIDAIKQLRASGDPDYLCNSSDITGMDASTLPTTRLLLRAALSVVFERKEFCTKPRFLCMDDSDVCMTMKKSKTSEEKKLLVQLSPISKMVDVVTSSPAPKSSLSDMLFAKSKSVNTDVFPSGLFGTSAQHSWFLYLVKRYAVVEYKKLYKKDVPEMVLYLLGDDKFEGYKYNKDDKKLESELNRDIINWIKLVKDILRECNYKEDALVSKFVGVFLQQAGFLGTYAPFPGRIDVFTDERSENVNAPPDVIINTIFSLLRKGGSRCYAPENGTVLGFSIWIVIKHLTVELGSKISEKNITSIINSINAKCGREVVQYEGFGKVSILFPVVLIFVTPISFPMPTTLIEKYNTVIHADMVTKLAGDGCVFDTIKPFLNKGKYDVWYNNLARTDEGKIHKLKGKLDINSFIDWEERDKYGFNISEWIVDIKRGSKRRLEFEKDSSLSNVIQNMATNIKSKLNQERFRKAEAAGAKLINKFGIDFPGKELGYKHMPKERILQALESVGESEEERLVLDVSFMKHLMMYKHMPPKHILEISNLLAIKHITTLDTALDVKVSSAYLLNLKFSFMPCMHRGSDYAALLAYTNVPTAYDSETNVSRVNEINTELSNHLNIDSIARICLRLVELSNEMYYVLLFGIYIGLSASASQKLFQVINDLMLNGFSTRFVPIFDKTIYFFISESTIPTFQNVIFDFDSSNYGIQNSYLYLYSRSFIFAKCKYFTKVFQHVEGTHPNLDYYDPNSAKMLPRDAQDVKFIKPHFLVSLFSIKAMRKTK